MIQMTILRVRRKPKPVISLSHTPRRKRRNIQAVLNYVASVGQEFYDRVLFDGGRVGGDEVVELGGKHRLHEVVAVGDDEPVMGFAHQAA